MEITRREFLIGSGSLALASAVPLSSLIPTAQAKIMTAPWQQGSMERARFLLAQDIAANLNGYFPNTGYTPAQVWEKVVNRQESVTGGCGVPQWLWGNVVYEAGDDEPELLLDTGHYNMFMIKDARGRWINKHYNVVHDISEGFGAWDVIGGINFDLWPRRCENGWDFCALFGLMPTQRILLRGEGDWHRTSYEYDEWDLDWASEIIYVSPPTKMPSDRYWDEWTNLRDCTNKP
jgi:hypothetical protein